MIPEEFMSQIIAISKLWTVMFGFLCAATGFNVYLSSQYLKEIRKARRHYELEED